MVERQCCTDWEGAGVYSCKDGLSLASDYDCLVAGTNSAQLQTM